MGTRNPGIASSARRRRHPRATFAVGLVTACAAGLVLAGTSAAQQIRGPLHGGQLAALSLSDGQALDLGPALPDCLLAPLELTVDVEGAPRRIVIEPASVRAPGFVVLVPGADGQLEATEAPPSHTLVGRVEGLDGSRAAGSLADGALHLLLRLETGGALWAIEPVPGGGHALYQASAVAGASGTCGTHVPSGRALAPTTHPAPTTQGALVPGTEVHVAEIALDADFEYFQLLASSVDNVIVDLEKVINQTRLIYEDEVVISYEITTIVVRTDADDPYTSSNSPTLLTQFRTEWNQAPLNAEPRDVAHLFTGRELNGSIIGIAFFDVLCTLSQSYGLSQSRFSPNLVARVALTAHELGHNWAADHCDDDGDCAIMCSAIGWCSGVLDQFGTAATAQITAKKLSVGCLTIEIAPPIPTLQALSPVFGPAAGGGVLELHGIDFPTDPLPTVTVGGTGAQVLSVTSTLLTVAIPPGTPGTAVNVAVSGEDFETTLLPSAYRYELSIQVGDIVTSTFTPLEVERFFFDGLAGSKVSARITPLGVSQGLLAGLRLIGPGEQELTKVEGVGTKAGLPVSLATFTITAGGQHRFEAYALANTQGTYRFTSKLLPMKSAKSKLQVSTASPGPTLGFSAVAGTLVPIAMFKSFAPKGKYALVDGEPANLLPALLGLDGPEGPIALDGLIEFAPKGNWVRVRLLTLPHSGGYTLRLGGVDETIGHGTASVKLKPPKPARQSHSLGS